MVPELQGGSSRGEQRRDRPDPQRHRPAAAGLGNRRGDPGGDRGTAAERHGVDAGQQPCLVREGLFYNARQQDPGNADAGTAQERAGEQAGGPEEATQHHAHRGKNKIFEVRPFRRC